MAARAIICGSYALGVTVRGIPFSFKDNNICMHYTRRVKKTLIYRDRNFCINQNINVAALLPCATTLRKSIRKVCCQKPLNVKGILKSCIGTGGAVNCDGVAQTNYGEMYYDFVVPFIREQWRLPPTMKSLVLYLRQSDGDTGEDIRLFLKKTLYNTMRLLFGLIMERYGNVLHLLHGCIYAQYVYEKNNERFEAVPSRALH